MKPLAAIAAICLAGMPTTATAASSAWHETTGGALRLVTTGVPDAKGRLKGILDIRLEPGWKTYWRDPGASGVPPTLNLGSAGTVAMQYPAPEWHHDGQFDWAGYRRSVALPLDLVLNRSGPIKATAFIGVCETICVPLQAKLLIDPWSDPENTADANEVSKATALLPAQATHALGIGIKSFANGHLILEGRMAKADGAELFVAGADGYQLGKPKLVMEGEKPVFTVKVLSQPATKPAGEGLHYTLVTPNGAVSGLIPYF